MRMRWYSDILSMSYKMNRPSAAEFVKTAKVTNNVVERGVKIASDYANILTIPETVITDRRSSRWWRKIDYTILISTRRH